MWSLLMLLAGIALGVSLLNPRRRSRGGRADGYPKRVSNIVVRVTYPLPPHNPGQPGSAPTILVAPWVAGVGENDDITWELQSTSGSDQLRIVPKDPNDWPFPGKPPANAASPGQRVRAGRVNAKMRPEPYSYDIELRIATGGPGSSGTWIRLDPELVIVWDSGSSKY